MDIVFSWNLQNPLIYLLINLLIYLFFLYLHSSYSPSLPERFYLPSTQTVKYGDRTGLVVELLVIFLYIFFFGMSILIKK